VENDKSKFGKRKYKAGKLVERQVVVGGFCRERKDVFLAVCLENRSDARTLWEITKHHMSKDSVVITDCWHAATNIIHPYVSVCVLINATCNVGTDLSAVMKRHLWSDRACY